ncbi:MAG TPA: DUF1080 domain-containing protein [Vicinamibacteria bacterium]|nr:DUF1080 domain-containing protein [Vicinamibacteria bacterium]
MPARVRKTVLAASLLVAGAQLLRAQVPPSTPSLLETSPEGWTSVQPGPDLAGWVRQAWPATDKLGPQQWSVDPETHHLVCDGTGGHDWLRLDRELADAALHVEWRFTPVAGASGYNSGVFARTAADESAWHQAQVGGVRTGYLFGLTPVKGQPQRLNLADRLRSFRVRAPGEWNTYELVARGRTISLWVNGGVTSEMTVEVPRGYFGLEGEGFRIEFRNLKLKVLEAQASRATPTRRSSTLRRDWHRLFGGRKYQLTPGVSGR